LLSLGDGQCDFWCQKVVELTDAIQFRKESSICTGVCQSTPVKRKADTDIDKFLEVMSEYQQPVEDQDQASKILIVNPVLHRKGRPKNLKSYVKWNAKRKFCKKSLIQTDDSCIIVDTKSTISYIRDRNQVAKAMLRETISFEQLDLTKLDKGDW
jgi:hypothetical protein